MIFFVQKIQVDLIPKVPWDQKLVVCCLNHIEYLVEKEIIEVEKIDLLEWTMCFRNFLAIPSTPYYFFEELLDATIMQILPKDYRAGYKIQVFLIYYISNFKILISIFFVNFLLIFAHGSTWYNLQYDCLDSTLKSSIFFRKKLYVLQFWIFRPKPPSTYSYSLVHANMKIRIKPCTIHFIWKWLSKASYKRQNI